MTYFDFRPDYPIDFAALQAGICSINWALVVRELESDLQLADIQSQVGVETIRELSSPG